MAFSHLLDTNILSELIRNPQGIVRDRIAEVGESSVCISLIVAAEVRYGCAKKNSQRLTEQADAILAALPILPLEANVDWHYADIRNDLEARGLLIGPNDLFIAAHARVLGLTLVRRNVREFKRVRGLKVQDWL